MNSTIIWAAAIGLIIIVFVPYLISFRRARRSAESRKQEAASLGIGKPRGQYPMVDRNLCIGCGSCVDACPEGDVLGVVWGVAEVINGERCVGHSYCEAACPVMALKVGLGDVKSRPDIPVLTETNESSVPNLFIAGELSGLSLIRHAIAQGTKVGEEVARRCRQNSASDGINDVLIVGAGPAGLSAALTAKKYGLKYLVVDQYDIGGTILHYPRRKLVMTQAVEIPLAGQLNHQEYSKEELLEMWQTVCERENVNVAAGQKVERIEQVDDAFAVTTTDGTRYRGRHVILALGRRGSPRKLGVPGEDLQKVMYALVDAKSYENKHMLVVGGGDSAIEAAIGLARQPGNTVSISYRKNKFFRIKKKNEDRVAKLIKSGDIKTYFESNVTQITPDNVLLSTPDGEVELRNDFVIIQAGGIPPYEMLKQAGIAFGGESYSIAERDRRNAQPITS